MPLEDPRDQLVSDREYVQRVRRHRPSSLLPLVAQAASRYPSSEHWLKQKNRKYTPWGLADVARVSLTRANEHRAEATERDLLICLNLYSQGDHPDLTEDATIDAVGRFLLRLGGEQLSYQQPMFNDFARSAALLDQTVPRREARVLTGDWARQLLGASISDYVGIGQLLYVSALQNEGAFSLSWLAQPNFVPITNAVSAGTIRSTVERLTTNADELREHEPPSLAGNDPWRRFGFNPLHASPLVEGYGNLLLPVPHMIVRKVSPLGIYYEGVQKWGNQFAEDLGDLFEAYVGRQLNLLDDVTVEPAITYGGDNRESVDWVVTMPQCVLLVEVKSVRPTEGVRLGGDLAAIELTRMLNRGFEQLTVTRDLIRERHPSFRHIPHDRPIVGLVVTMEPFHAAHAGFLNGFNANQQSTDYLATLCSATDLESLVSVDDAEPGEILAGLIGDDERRGWDIGSILSDRTIRRNEVLDEGWRAYPWRERKAPKGSP